MAIDYTKFTDIFDVDLFLSSKYTILKFKNNYSIITSLNIYSLDVIEVIIPEGVTEIGDWAFASYDSLEKVTLPSTLKIIGDYAFERCMSIEEIDIPDGVEKIGRNAFDAAYNLKRIKLPKELSKINVSTFYECSLKSITIPENVCEIDYTAFCENEDLKEIIFLGEYPLINSEAFLNCDKICKIVYNNKIYGCFKDLEDDIGPKKKYYDEKYCYPDDGELDYFYSGIKEVLFPPGETYIHFQALRGLVNLRKITLPNTLIKIHEEAFMGCLSLEEIILPEGLKSIEFNAFNYCTSLKKVSIPNTVTRLDAFSFESCHSLEEINLPNSIDEFNLSVIRYCNNIKTLDIPYNVKKIYYDRYNSLQTIYTGKEASKDMFDVIEYECAGVFEGKYKFVRKV